MKATALPRFSQRVPRARLWLAGIILLAAVLHFSNLSALGDANTYYTAAIKSMLQSWRNFFFIAAEPGGSVTVDKPPLGLWVEAAFAFLFGVKGWAVALPNMLAGILSVPLLYALVERHLGELAGLVAALALTLTPVFVATNRNNTMDGLLTFTLLLAAGAFLRAVETGRLRWLLAGAALIGLGFETKMLQAFLPLPAFYALYFFGAKEKWGIKIGRLALVSLVILGIGLAWPLAVDLTPPENRPYVGSSENNTVMELIIGHNGLSRLFNPHRKDGSAAAPTAPDGKPNPPEGNMLRPPQGNPPPEALAACESLSPGVPCTVTLPNDRTVNGLCHPVPGGGELACAPPPQGGPPPSRFGDGPSASPQQGGTPFSNETGSPGIARFFLPPLAKQMSWLLPFGLLGMFLLVFSARPRLPLAVEHQFLLLWGGWLLTCLVFFSAVEGIFHAYYVIMLAPPLAALVGAAFAWFWQRLSTPAARVGLVLAAGGTIAFQIYAAHQEGVHAGWLWIAPVLWIVSAIGLGIRRLRRVGAWMGILAMLLIPAVWSGLTVFDLNPQVNLPSAWSPSPSRQPPAERESLSDALLGYLQNNPPRTAYLAAVPNAHLGAPLVLATGQPVLYMGGFSGGDPVIDADGLEALVTRGELRYVLYGMNGEPDIVSWLRASCRPVPAVFGATRNQPMQLYDCAPSNP